MSRICSVVDSIDCEASADGLATVTVVTCWACGDDTCRACSSIVSYGRALESFKGCRFRDNSGDLETAV